jgi:dTDP-4-amino-4,6-dideoxygalactose transaminase
VSHWRIPLFDTRFGPEEEAAVLRPLRAGWLTMGEEVVELENEIREVTGARHAIAVSNCTAALQLASAALGLGPGDEVIAPSLTFVATANAPRSLGATVRLAEVTSAQDLCVDPDSIEALITPRTRAIFVVHFAGFPCRMDEIVALADEHGIPVVEDAAHAVFGRHRGRTLGLHGRVGCYSFYSNKNATCGEGGALVTDDDELARQMRLLRSHGMTTPTLDRHRGRATSYDVVMPGYNMRLDEIRAALLRVQLGRLPGALKRRRELFRLYAEALAGTPVELPFRGGRFESELDETAVHILPVLLPEGSDRDAVMARMKEAGVQTSIHYPPVHHFACYATAEDELPRTTALAKRELTLPFFPALPDTDVPVVVDALLRSLEDR